MLFSDAERLQRLADPELASHKANASGGNAADQETGQQKTASQVPRTEVINVGF